MYLQLEHNVEGGLQLLRHGYVFCQCESLIFRSHVRRVAINNRFDKTDCRSTLYVSMSQIISIFGVTICLASPPVDELYSLKAALSIARCMMSDSRSDSDSGVFGILDGHSLVILLSK